MGFAMGFSSEQMPCCCMVRFAMEATKLTFKGGFHKWGYPNSWRVYVVENPTKMDDEMRYP